MVLPRNATIKVATYEQRLLNTNFKNFLSVRLLLIGTCTSTYYDTNEKVKILIEYTNRLRKNSTY